jgi:hypothetical protein
MIRVLLPGGGYEDFAEADGFTVQRRDAALPYSLVIWKVDPDHKSHTLLGVFPSGGWLGFRPSDLGPGIQDPMGFRPANEPPPTFGD